MAVHIAALRVASGASSSCFSHDHMMLAALLGITDSPSSLSILERSVVSPEPSQFGLKDLSNRGLPAQEQAGLGC